MRGFRKSKNMQILKVTALYVMWNPEICQDPPTCGQDDLVLWQLQTIFKQISVAFLTWHKWHSRRFPRWHWHSEQNSLLMHGPQQSPPSKLQSGLLVSSLQYPFPINGFATLCSPTSDLRHVHCEHWSFTMHSPQQSPPSKLHSGLFVSSWQNPSPIKYPFGQAWI